MRVEKTWRVERNAEGRVVIHLATVYHFASPSGGRYARTSLTLNEPLGQDLLESIHRQQSAAIEASLGEGARVEGLEGALLLDTPDAPLA